MRFVITILILALTTFIAFGQRRTIKGRLVSVEDKTPLPGFSVIEPGTTNGTLTDANGEFTLTVNAHPTIVMFPQCFSSLYVEYKEDEEFKVVVFGANQKGLKYKISKKTAQQLLKSSPTRQLNGLVLYKKSRKPVNNCEVRIKGTHDTAYTGEDGSFTITVPNNKMTELEFRKKGTTLQSIAYDTREDFKKIKLKLSDKN